jgi:phosphatidylglycerol lysyltransferase
MSFMISAIAILAVTAAVLIGCALGRQSLRLGPVTIELPSSGLVLIQIVATMVDIVVASGTLWVLLPASGVDFHTFLVIYTGALSLGVLSHAPGGSGVFDAAVLYALGMQGSPCAVAALVTYRAIYFLLPFALAAVLLAATELRRLLRRRRSAPGGNGQERSSSGGWKPGLQQPSVISGDIHAARKRRHG